MLYYLPMGKIIIQGEYTTPTDTYPNTYGHSDRNTNTDSKAVCSS